MINLTVIKKLLVEGGVVNLGKNSILSLYNHAYFEGKDAYHTLVRTFRTPKNGLTNSGKVYIVICIDAEGPNKYNKYKDWDSILSDFKNLFLSHPHIKINFFVVDWLETVGNVYSEKGYHKIFDKYKKFKHIYWHYHHPPDGQVDHIMDWDGKSYYEDIINRKIIDRKHFPSLFRAGHTFEGKKARKWLRKWIPFDLSNRAPYKPWTNYPDSWEPVKEGRRTIFRSIDAENPKWANLHETDYAFMKASEGKDVLISFFTHDYKDFTKHILYIDKLINCSSKRYPSIQYKYTDGLHAIRKVLAQKEFRSLYLTITKRRKKLVIKSNRSIYQRYPYVVLKQNSHYTHIEDVTRVDKTTWEVKIKQNFNKLGVAVSDKYGYSAVKVLKNEDFNNKSSY